MEPETPGRGRRLIVFAPGLTESGGAARRSSLICSGLAQRGWDIRVVTRAGTRHSFRLARSSGLTVVEVPGFDRKVLGGLLFLAAAIPLGLIWGARSSAFLCIQLASQATAGALCATPWRRPFLVFSTTGGSVSEVDYVLSGRLRGPRRRLLGGAAYLIAQSASGVRDLSRLGEEQKVRTIPNPVAASPKGKLDGRPRAVFTGRLSQEKDLRTLLDVWRKVAIERPEAMLTIVGEGGRHRSVEKDLRAQVAADPALQRTVTFTGWVEDVDAYLRTSDVFVLPSLSEGMSNALLEACARRRVVVASDIEPNKAVLGHQYPLLFRAGDVDALAAALKLAFDDASTRQHAIDTIERSLARFSVDRVLGQIEELVESAIEARTGPRP